MRDTTLSELMEFDRVICVEDGVVLENDPRTTSEYAPECIWEGFGEKQHISPESGWTLLDGYSRQDRYSGPIMHESELSRGRDGNRIS